ncbi:MAG: flagella basal body P-ring formation protein FlgA [Hyphomonadaceae bacterium]|nr:MAG: flagella basal body P-ring formation protein FlgA [Hyphomonadaceae bacterium]
MSKSTVSLILKILTAIIALAAFIFFSTGKSVAQNAAPSLKAVPTISGPNITLGDLFNNAGAASSRILARAPQNGQSMVFSASALQARAASMGLRWTNPDGVRQVIIGSGGTMPITSTTPGLGARPTGAAVAVTRDLVVLTRDVAKDEIINADMVSWISSDAAIAPDTILDASQLIGNSAKRNLRGGTPVRAADIGPTMAVRRGQPVTLIHEASGLKISLRGRALTDGTIGGSIRAVNIASNRTLEAIVESQGVARVLIPTTSTQITTTAQN